MAPPPNSLNHRQRLRKHFRATATSSSWHNPQCNTKAVHIRKQWGQSGAWSEYQTATLSQVPVNLHMYSTACSHRRVSLSPRSAPSNPPNPQPSLHPLWLTRPLNRSMLPRLACHSGRSRARQHDWQVGMGRGPMETKNPSLNPYASRVLFQFTHLFFCQANTASTHTPIDVSREINCSLTIYIFTRTARTKEYFI